MRSFVWNTKGKSWPKNLLFTRITQFSSSSIRHKTTVKMPIMVKIGRFQPILVSSSKTACYITVVEILFLSVLWCIMNLTKILNITKTLEPSIDSERCLSLPPSTHKRCGLLSTWYGWHLIKPRFYRGEEKLNCTPVLARSCSCCLSM